MKPTQAQIDEAAMVFVAAREVFGFEKSMSYMQGWTLNNEARMDAWRMAQSPGKHRLPMGENAKADPALVEAIKKATQEAATYAPHPGLARN